MNAERAASGTRSPAGLRGRLAAFARADVHLLNRVFEREKRWLYSAQPTMFWFEPRLAPKAHGGEQVEVVINGRPGQLHVASTRLESIGELHWTDYIGAARLTAWSLAHARTMTRLSRVFDAIVLPQSLASADPSADAQLIPIGFRTGNEQGVLDEGVLHLDPLTVERLLSRAGIVEAKAPVQGRWLGINMPLLVCARGPRLRVDEVRALERGDVLMLGRRSEAMAQLRLMAGDGATANGAESAVAWQASWNNGNVQLVAATAAGIDPWRSISMNVNDTDNDNPVANAAEGAAAPVAAHDPLANLDIGIEFVLGQTSVPLSRLSQFTPGYLFELAAPLDDARVGIRANGKLVGHGRLVALGDTLGVQLEGWAADGLQ